MGIQPVKNQLKPFPKVLFWGTELKLW